MRPVIQIPDKNSAVKSSTRLDDKTITKVGVGVISVVLILHLISPLFVGLGQELAMTLFAIFGWV